MNILRYHLVFFAGLLSLSCEDASQRRDRPSSELEEAPGYISQGSAKANEPIVVSYEQTRVIVPEGAIEREYTVSLKYSEILQEPKQEFVTLGTSTQDGFLEIQIYDSDRRIFASSEVGGYRIEQDLDREIPDGTEVGLAVLLNPGTSNEEVFLIEDVRIDESGTALANLNLNGPTVFTNTSFTYAVFRFVTYVPNSIDSTIIIRGEDATTAGGVVISTSGEGDNISDEETSDPQPYITSDDVVVLFNDSQGTQKLGLISPSGFTSIKLPDHVQPDQLTGSQAWTLTRDSLGRPLALIVMQGQIQYFIFDGSVWLSSSAKTPLSGLGEPVFSDVYVANDGILSLYTSGGEGNIIHYNHDTNNIGSDSWIHRERSFWGSSVLPRTLVEFDEGNFVAVTKLADNSVYLDQFTGDTHLRGASLSDSMTCDGLAEPTQSDHQELSSMQHSRVALQANGDVHVMTTCLLAGQYFRTYWVNIQNMAANENGPFLILEIPATTPYYAVDLAVASDGTVYIVQSKNIDPDMDSDRRVTVFARRPNSTNFVSEHQFDIPSWSQTMYVGVDRDDTLHVLLGFSGGPGFESGLHHLTNEGGTYHSATYAVENLDAESTGNTRVFGLIVPD